MSLTATTRAPREIPTGAWICWRCGLLQVTGTTPPESGACESCRLSESTSQSKRKRWFRDVPSRVEGLGKCRAWLGDFDDDTDTPLGRDGLPLLPGERICGHRDCVSPEHVVP